MTSITTILFSCSDVVVPDISKQTVNVIAPVNGLKSSSTTISFWWDGIKNANKYRIQLVSPNFSTIQNFILDTSTTQTKYNLTLQPGNYQCRIRAENSAYYTNYTTLSFSVDSSLSLTNQKVALVSPSNNFITNNPTQKFQWQPLNVADDYRFEITSSGGTIYSNPAYAKDTITYYFATDGVFKWRVRAQNSSSVTAYTEYNITIDATNPAIPTLLTPVDGDSLSFTVGTGKTRAAILLNWSSAIDYGTAITDSVYVYQTIGSSNTFVIKNTATTNSHADSLTRGTYYWYVRAIDAAGNKSNNSSIRRFKTK